MRTREHNSEPPEAAVIQITNPPGRHRKALQRMFGERKRRRLVGLERKPENVDAYEIRASDFPFRCPGRSNNATFKEGYVDDCGVPCCWRKGFLHQSN